MGRSIISKNSGTSGNTCTDATLAVALAAALAVIHATLALLVYEPCHLHAPRGVNNRLQPPLPTQVAPIRILINIGHNLRVQLVQPSHPLLLVICHHEQIQVSVPKRTPVRGPAYVSTSQTPRSAVERSAVDWLGGVELMQRLVKICPAVAMTQFEDKAFSRRW
jgi:hypothetical protein